MENKVSVDKNILVEIYNLLYQIKVDGSDVKKLAYIEQVLEKAVSESQEVV